ncbi:methylated-DNA--[protein]-cysteine S-methyltransferase [Naumannella huperziae]
MIDTNPPTTAPETGFGTLDTVGGGFGYLWRDEDGTPVVLASGWTTDPEELRALVHPSLRPGSVRPRNAAAVDDAVRAWGDGELTALDSVAVRQRSGPFLEQAWQVLRTVRGTVTYTEFAELSGNRAASRAAASACARNAAALFVPCHRVLRTDGSLGGFRYGLQVKSAVLDHESSYAAG